MARASKEAQWKLDDCACVVTTTKYIKMCAKHEAEHKAIHDRWTAEKKAAEKAREEEDAIKKA